jgi:hypothetical protein
MKKSEIRRAIRERVRLNYSYLAYKEQDMAEGVGFGLKNHVFTGEITAFY